MSTRLSRTVSSSRGRSRRCLAIDARNGLRSELDLSRKSGEARKVSHPVPCRVRTLPYAYQRLYEQEIVVHHEDHDKERIWLDTRNEEDAARYNMWPGVVTRGHALSLTSATHQDKSH